MNNRILVILLIVGISAGFISYIYYQNTVCMSHPSFLHNPQMNNLGDCLLFLQSDASDVPKFDVLGLDRQYFPNEPIMISVQKIGYNMCDSWEAKIIDTSNGTVVWEDWNVTSCGEISPPRIDTFTYAISTDARIVTVPDVGDYLFQIDMGDKILEEEFTVIEQTKLKLIERGWTKNETQSNQILTKIDCVEGQLIYNDECIYVLTTTDEYPKGIKHFLLSKDGKITQYVELEIATSTSGQTGNAVTLDRSTAISSYTISDDNVIEFTLENENVFYGKPLSYWKNLDEDSLVNYYENFGKFDEHFFEDLGALLIKSHAKEKLHELETIPKEIEIDWEGIRPSLPPRMGFYATVNSTDDKNYHITGTIHGNVIQDNFQIVQDSGRRIGWTPAFEYSRVQINGTTALQICSILETICIENPVWDAVHRHDKDFTYFYYETSDIEHYVKIDDGYICHSTENFTSQEISELKCQEISNTKPEKN